MRGGPPGARGARRPRTGRGAHHAGLDLCASQVDLGGRFNGLAEQCCADSPSDLLDGLLPLEQPNRGRRSSTRRSGRMRSRSRSRNSATRSTVPWSYRRELAWSGRRASTSMMTMTGPPRTRSFLNEGRVEHFRHYLNARLLRRHRQRIFPARPGTGTAGGMRCVHEGGVATSTAIMTWANTSQAMQSS